MLEVHAHLSEEECLSSMLQIGGEIFEVHAHLSEEECFRFMLTFWRRNARGPASVYAMMTIQDFPGKATEGLE
jgi:hypothetical protein